MVGSALIRFEFAAGFGLIGSMKWLFVLVGFFPMVALAERCPDLSGHYTAPAESEASVVSLVVKQTGCSAIEFSFDAFDGYPYKESYVLDHQPRLVADNEDVRLQQTAWIDDTGVHLTEEHTKRVKRELDEIYTEYTNFFSPKPSQLVIKWEQWNPAKVVSARGKTTFERVE